MIEILQETTQWSGGFTCNHTYLIVDGAIVAYIKVGETVVNKLAVPIKIDKRGRKFITVKNEALRSVISGQKTNSRLFEVKSKDNTYTVEVTGRKFTCNCTGFLYRHKCKHVEAVKEKLLHQNNTV